MVFPIEDRPETAVVPRSEVLARIAVLEPELAQAAATEQEMIAQRKSRPNDPTAAEARAAHDYDLRLAAASAAVTQLRGRLDRLWARARTAK